MKSIALSKRLRPYAIGRGLRATLWWLFRWLLLIGVFFIILQPIFIKLSAAFMSKQDLYDVTVLWVPKHFTLDNFRMALDNMDFTEALRNTLTVSLLTTALSLLSCTLAAYGFARFRFRGRELLFFLVLLTLVIPPQAYSVSMYTNFLYFDFFGLARLFGSRGISLLNGSLPFVLLAAGCMGIKNGLYILIMRQIFRNMPMEIEEAATVDGAGTLRTFFQIMLPNAKPGLVTVGLISFVWQWNDTFYANLLAPDLPLLSSAVTSLGSRLNLAMGDWAKVDFLYLSLVTNAGILLLMLPLIGLYILAQKWFVEGVERTGIVG